MIVHLRKIFFYFMIVWTLNFPKNKISHFDKRNVQSS